MTGTGPDLSYKYIKIRISPEQQLGQRHPSLPWRRLSPTSAALHADDGPHGVGWLRGCSFSGLCTGWLIDGKHFGCKDLPALRGCHRKLTRYGDHDDIVIETEVASREEQVPPSGVGYSAEMGDPTVGDERPWDVEETKGPRSKAGLSRFGTQSPGGLVGTREMTQGTALSEPQLPPLLNGMRMLKPQDRWERSVTTPLHAAGRAPIRRLKEAASEDLCLHDC
nr:PREDICTED: uncharacterized protein LOC103542448 [Equus przewalskii]